MVNLKINDLVHLNLLGGPTMLVVGERAQYPLGVVESDLIECVWFVGSQLHDFAFPEECLVKINKR